jgi:hypothetical protein
MITQWISENPALTVIFILVIISYIFEKKHPIITGIIDVILVLMILSLAGLCTGLLAFSVMFALFAFFEGGLPVQVYWGIGILFLLSCYNLGILDGLL